MYKQKKKISKIKSNCVKKANLYLNFELAYMLIM